jgi:hypothetical protein
MLQIENILESARSPLFDQFLNGHGWFCEYSQSRS